MKKLFLFFAAMLVAVAVNAATINVESGKNTIRTALSSAAEGDVLVLAGGTYTDDNYIEFTKAVELQPAEDAETIPVIQIGTYIKVQNGAKVKITGLKIDGSQQGSRDQIFRVYEGNNSLELVDCEFTAGKKPMFRVESGKNLEELILTNCKFYDNVGKIISNEGTIKRIELQGCEISGNGDIVVNGKSTSHADECIVNNCYFHNNVKQSIYFEASGTEGVQTCDKLEVKNSTFVNTTALTDWISIVEVRPYGSAVTDAIKVIVDHCTFYNNPCVDSGHANIRTHYLSDVSVSNCIFMHPTELAQRATYCDGGGTVSNCLTYNFTKDPGRYGISYGCTIVACFAADPQFIDAENGDFKLDEASPAVDAGTDGKTLGDPRWWPVIVNPETDFTTPYVCTPAKAKISGKVTLRNDSLVWNNNSDASQNGVATWKINVTKACFVSATISEGTSAGHCYSVSLLDADGNPVGEPIAEAADTWKAGDLLMPGTLLIPEAGEYTFKLSNSTNWSKSAISALTLTYVSDLPQTLYLKLSEGDGNWASWPAKYAIYYYRGELNGWSEFMTAVPGEENIYVGTIPAEYADDKIIFVRLDGEATAPNWNSKWSQTVNLEIPEGKDLFTVTSGGTGNECNGVWSKYGEEYVPVLPNGFYLVGTFGGEGEWSFADLNESKKFAATEVEGEYTLNYTLAKGDLFKAVYVENDAIKTWYPEGTGNDYLVTEWTAGEKTIYFRPKYHEAWGGHFYIEANKPEVTYSDFEIVLYEGQLGTDKDNPNNAYLTVSGEQYTYSQEMPLAYNAYLTSANYNGAQHGYTNLVVTMPVEAGNYKVTLGTSIKKADDSETYKTFNQNIGEGKNYKTNPAEYIVSTVFSVAEAQMIKIVCGNYTPYIKVEQVANIEYAVTFAVEEGVRGIVPAPVAIVDGESYTVPANTTLYLDGQTLTGWTDGENTYAPGDVFTPEADATLTAVFAENTASLLTGTVPGTVQWNFGLTEGAPTVAWEGENKGRGFLVAQATIGETKVDVPLDIDARSGKFANSGRKDYWAQVNAGAKLYFPAKKGAEVEVFTYADPATTTVDKATQTGTWTDNKSQFITTATTDASIMEVQENSYYRYLKVTYPASEATAISNTGAEVKAQKVIENGQIFILKNGVKYNVLGASVK